ncbi:MAG: hypothetical protein K2Y27_15945 [Xanthobacteraceae bacterium]|nr:hypothetical protein [Xanthobacteraceae bacterium]
MKPACYDPDTIKTLQHALDLAWDALPTERRLRTSKVALAERILWLAANGERDLARLKAGAIIELVPPPDDKPDVPSPPPKGSTVR